MTDQPDTIDPIERMPPQLREANRRKRSNGGMGNPPVGANTPLTLEDRVAAMEAGQAEILSLLKGQAARPGASQFIDQAPDPSPPVREADEEELTPFQRELRNQTSEMPPDYVREAKNYNFDLKWFSKHDGSIVQLQGDPGNTEYYRKKGFHELTPAQVERYLKVERLEILKIQQAKANLIENIRRLFLIEPKLAVGAPKFETDKDQMTVAELEQYWAQMTFTRDDDPRFRLQRPKRLQDADDKRAQAESARLLAGVETTPSRTARAQFEAMQEQIRTGGQGRTIEVTPGNANQFA